MIEKILRHHHPLFDLSDRIQSRKAGQREAFAAGVISLLQAVVVSWYPLDAKGNLKSRAAQARRRVLRKIALAVPVIITLGVTLGNN